MGGVLFCFFFCILVGLLLLLLDIPFSRAQP